MRRVILGVAVSLDGFIEGPNGEYDWCFTDQDYGMKKFMGRIDATFVGRKTYEMSLGMEDPGGAFPKLKEYIFSNTLKSVKPGATLVNDDIQAQVRAIKEERGKDIWLFGGADLTKSLMDLGLVDELWLAVHPILLGGGKLLFQSSADRVPLKLTESKTYDTGLVSLHYEILGKGNSAFAKASQRETNGYGRTKQRK